MAATVNTADMGRTSIQVSDELADELHDRKKRGESYEDVVWRLIEAADAQEDIATSGSSEAVERTPKPRREPSGVDAEEPPAEDAFADVDFPQGRDRAECIEAIHAARDYLRENGKATMRDFVTDVMPDHPIGYDVPQLEPGDRYRGAWWRRVVKPGLKALPGVQSPATGQSEFRYVGENGT